MTSRAAIVRIAAATYAGVVVLLTVQALRAQPLLQPDAITSAAWLLVATGVGMAVGLVVRGAARPATLVPAA